jgi:PhnB protein
MSQSTDKAEIEALLERLKKAHHERDAAASGAEYSDDPVIYNLAPPLKAEGGLEELAAWFDTWSGPVTVENRSFQIAISGDLALAHGFQHVSAVTKEGGETAAWWMRTTFGLQRIGGAWKVIHEHGSVPFYMDGSFKAALDLEP